MCRKLERVSGEWIGVVRNIDLRGYVKQGEEVKERYAGKYGVGERIKAHRDGSYYNETIRTIQRPDLYFTASFRRKSDAGDIYKYKDFSVLNVVKKNDGWHCMLADGITAILTNDWTLVECDVWEVLGV